MAVDVSFGAALAYGALSFLSPCVLPLVPPYLVYISGISLDELQVSDQPDAIKQSRKVMQAAMAFVLGFTTVFVLLGATASFFGQMLRSQLPLLSTLAGVLIIIMGLHFLGVFRIGWFNREVRYQTKNQPAGLLGAYAVGMAFAFGWTPCIGPVLAAILSVAANSESVGQGMALLATYSLGLGIPFLIAGYSVSSFMAFFRRFKTHLLTVERIMGVLLVLTGILFLSGAMQRFSFWLLETFPALGNIG
jgi:cytochrome c-type biogenesis protein